MLHVINRGVVVYGPDMLVTGSIFGQEALLLTGGMRHLRKTWLARILSYVQCSTIGPTTFNEVMSRFPKSKKQLRRSTILLALTRKIILLADVAKREEQAVLGRFSVTGNGMPKLGGNMLDIVIKSAGSVTTEDREANEHFAARPGSAHSSGGNTDLGRVRSIVRQEVQEALDDALKPILIALGQGPPPAMGGVVNRAVAANGGPRGAASRLGDQARRPDRMERTASRLAASSDRLASLERNLSGGKPPSPGTGPARDRRL